MRLHRSEPSARERRVRQIDNLAHPGSKPTNANLAHGAKSLATRHEGSDAEKIGKAEIANVYHHSLQLGLHGKHGFHAAVQGGYTSATKLPDQNHRTERRNAYRSDGKARCGGPEWRS